ncbi:hypothetical protein ACF1AO_14250 [Streptomyces longwoodensis]|uniref:hypothetical protein n=1 Tax=Streptomyces longwoodensis TaxID=68231 RepID=UPI0037031ECE
MRRAGFVPYRPSSAAGEALSRVGPPIVWLASDEATGMHDERIVAAEFDPWLRDRERRW